MQVEEFVQISADKYSNKIALICNGQRLTYEEIEQQSNQIAHALFQFGIHRGDRVAVHLDNSIEAALSIFGILKAGAVFVMVNPTTKSDKLGFILNNCRASGLITHTRKVVGLRDYWERLPHLKTCVIVGEKETSEVLSAKGTISFHDCIGPHGLSRNSLPRRCIDIDLAALIYTSGSTGNPKGVMMTHLNIVSAATSITTYLENRQDDIILNVLPLSFDYGLYQLLMAMKVGGTLVLERSFGYPSVVLERIQQEKATGFPIVPTIAAILLQMDLKKYDLSSLRYLTNTAAALPTEHIAGLRTLFPKAKLFSMYGLTECKRVSYLPPEQLDIRPESVGRGMPNEEVYIVDDDGNTVEPGIVGELVVRGTNVMKGYWEMPEETAKVLRPGFLPDEKVLYTGDLFRMDEEGYLYFVGRKDDIIKSRGEKVSPKEVENVLASLNGIAEVAVVGVPDDILGEAVKACIVLKEDIRLNDRNIRLHCSRHLEDYMMPKFIEFFDSLPKTPNGKVDKRMLKNPCSASIETSNCLDCGFQHQLEI